MARIRTVKPSFFRHGALQDLEVAHLGKHCMLVFAGLWGHCDRAGVFECDTRQLKLDILPFLPFDMAETIAILEQAGFLRTYQANGKQYAVIPTFLEHQSLGGKEAQEPVKYPSPPREATGKHSGSNGEVIEQQQGQTSEATGKHLPAQEVEGNGIKEGKGNGEEEGSGKPKVAALPLPAWLNAETWNEWLKVRKKKSNTPGSLQASLRKLEKWKSEGHDANAIVATSLENGWQGLFLPDAKRGNGSAQPIVTQPKKCGNCGNPLTGGWSQSPKGRVCDSCHRGYMGGIWPERAAA